MIAAGIKISLLGTAVVFLFLGALIVVIEILRKRLASVTERERLENELRLYPKVSAEPDGVLGGSRLAAIITAAVSAHRARFLRRPPAGRGRESNR